MYLREIGWAHRGKNATALTLVKRKKYSFKRAKSYITGKNIPLNKAPKFVISLNPFSAGRKTLMLLSMISTAYKEPSWSTSSHGCFSALNAPWVEREVSPYEWSSRSTVDRYAGMYMLGAEE